MTKHHTPTDAERITALEGCVKHLSAEIGRLHAELAEFRAELAREVRTQRLAVVEPVVGRELLYTTVGDDGLSLRVEWLPDQCYVAIEVGDQSGGEAAVTVGGTTQGVVSIAALQHADQHGSHRTDGYVSLTPAKWTGRSGVDYREDNPPSVELDGKGLVLDAGALKLRPTMAVES